MKLSKMSSQMLVLCALIYASPVILAVDESSLPVIPDTGANFDPAKVDTVPSGGKTRGIGQNTTKRLPPAPTKKADIIKMMKPPVKSRGINSGKTRAVGRAYINFAVDSAEITPVSEPLLSEWVAALQSQELAGTLVTVEGHTDSTGADDYNIELSARRAEAVANYLTQAGVDRSRLNTVSQGKNSPLVSNATSSGRAINRRVQFYTQQGGFSSQSVPPTTPSDQPYYQ